MNLKAEYITDQDHSIFTVYHPPLLERESREGVLICPPAPYEIRRSHRALRNLAQNLAKAGYHVLRFDYRGTGDSSGSASDWSLDAWKSDIKRAAEHLRRTYDISRLSMVGLRLGGSLGLKALEDESLKRLILWDPIFDGKSYLTQLKASHEWMLAREADRPPYARKPSRPQRLGFPHTQSWDDDLSHFHLDIKEHTRGFIVHSDGENREFPIGLMKRLFADDDQKWANPALLHLQSLAHPSLALIEKAMEGRL